MSVTCLFDRGKSLFLSTAQVAHQATIRQKQHKINIPFIQTSSKTIKSRDLVIQCILYLLNLWFYDFWDRWHETWLDKVGFETFNGKVMNIERNVSFKFYWKGLRCCMSMDIIAMTYVNRIHMSLKMVQLYSIQ